MAQQILDSVYIVIYPRSGGRRSDGIVNLIIGLARKQSELLNAEQSINFKL